MIDTPMMVLMINCLVSALQAMISIVTLSTQIEIPGGNPKA